MLVAIAWTVTTKYPFSKFYPAAFSAPLTCRKARSQSGQVVVFQIFLDQSPKMMKNGILIKVQHSSLHLLARSETLWPTREVFSSFLFIQTYSLVNCVLYFSTILSCV